MAWPRMPSPLRSARLFDSCTAAVVHANAVSGRVGDSSHAFNADGFGLDRVSANGDNNELCVVEDPAAGPWVAAVVAFSAYSNVTFTANFVPGT